jgi:hypothetical protein
MKRFELTIKDDLLWMTGKALPRIKRGKRRQQHQVRKFMNTIMFLFGYVPMPRLALLAVIYMTFFALFSAQFFTHAFFTDSAVSSTNVFAAAATFPTGTPPITSPQPGDVVINEINWAGNDSNDDDEWIELRNMTNQTVNIAGWVIDGLGSGTASITVPAGSIIEPNGYFIISNYDQATSAINILPDVINSSINLANGGEQLILRTSSGGTIIDTANDPNATGVVSTSEKWCAGHNGPSGGPTESMERASIPGDGTVCTSWHEANEHTNMDDTSPTGEFASPKAANSL